jgi:hypothetical protein
MRGTWTAAFTTALLLASASLAQDLPAEPGPARTVGIFDRFCYHPLPSLDVIATIAAAGGFSEITGAELQRYQPPVAAAELRAWKFEDLGSAYTLTTARSHPDEEFARALPQFAESTNYACSLIVENQLATAELLEATAALLGREPDESWEQTPLRASQWCGMTEEVFACVYFWAPMTTNAQGLLSATIFVK